MQSHPVIENEEDCLSDCPDSEPPLGGGVSPTVGLLPPIHEVAPPTTTPVIFESENTLVERRKQHSSPVLGISISTSSSEVNVMLSNLKLLSNVPVGAKLAIRNNTIIIHDKGSWMDMVTRMYNGDSREQVTHYLEEFVKRIGDVLVNNSVDKTTKIRIIDGITLSQNGMMHIKNTYYGDITTRTKIETIIENMLQLLPNNSTPESKPMVHPTPSRPIQIPPSGSHSNHPSLICSPHLNNAVNEEECLTRTY